MQGALRPTPTVEVVTFVPVEENAMGYRPPPKFGVSVEEAARGFAAMTGASEPSLRRPRRSLLESVSRWLDPAVWAQIDALDSSPSLPPVRRTEDTGPA